SDARARVQAPSSCRAQGGIETTGARHRVLCKRATPAPALSHIRPAPGPLDMLFGDISEAVFLWPWVEFLASANCPLDGDSLLDRYRLEPEFLFPRFAAGRATEHRSRGFSEAPQCGPLALGRGGISTGEMLASGPSLVCHQLPNERLRIKSSIQAAP